MMALLPEIVYLPITGRNHFLQKLFCFVWKKKKWTFCDRLYPQKESFINNAKAKVCLEGRGYPVKSEKDHGGENSGPSPHNQEIRPAVHFLHLSCQKAVSHGEEREEGEVNRMSIWTWREELASPVFPHIPTRFLTQGESGLHFSHSKIHGRIWKVTTKHGHSLFLIDFFGRRVNKTGLRGH